VSIIRVIHKRPTFDAEIIEVEDSLEAFRALLDGGYLEAVRLSSEVVLYCDEDGIANDLPPNCIFNGTMILGPLIITPIRDGRDIGFVDRRHAEDVCRQLNGGPT